MQYMLFFPVPDTSLIECLTKINRMDIVHLLQTNTEPLLERASHSYAEMEQIITLDHSEGQAVRVPACACVTNSSSWATVLSRGGARCGCSHVLLAALRPPCPLEGAHAIHSLLIHQSLSLVVRQHHKLCGLKQFFSVLETGSPGGCLLPLCPPYPSQAGTPQAHLSTPSLPAATCWPPPWDWVSTWLLRGQTFCPPGRRLG